MPLRITLYTYVSNQTNKLYISYRHIYACISLYALSFCCLMESVVCSKFDLYGHICTCVNYFFLTGVDSLSIDLVRYSKSMFVVFTCDSCTGRYC